MNGIPKSATIEFTSEPEKMARAGRTNQVKNKYTKMFQTSESEAVLPKADQVIDNQPRNQSKNQDSANNGVFIPSHLKKKSMASQQQDETKNPSRVVQNLTTRLDDIKAQRPQTSKYGKEAGATAAGRSYFTNDATKADELAQTTSINQQTDGSFKGLSSGRRALGSLGRARLGKK